MVTDLAIASFALLFLQQAPVPDPEKQKESEKLVRELFKEEYARKTAADRSALARKLLEQAQDSAGDPVSRFVLLREASDLAAQAGDVATSLKAIDQLGAAYAVDTLALKSAAYGFIGKSIRAPEDLSSLATAYLKLVDEASEKDQYDIAKLAAESASALARRLKDMPMVTRADAKAREAGDRREKYAKLKKAQQTLVSSPDDPESNLVIGQFECWAKGDWEQGLRRLVKGSDPALKALAEEDLAAPADVASRIKLGDSWWDLAEKADVSRKSNIQERARHWYRLAVTEAQGLTKAKVELRLKGSWVPLFDGKTLGCVKDSSQPAWEVVDGVLCKRSTSNEGLQSRQLFLDGEFRIRFENKGLTRMTFSVRQGVKGKDALLFDQPKITEMEGQVHEILFQCKGPEVKAFLDGQPAVLFSKGPVAEGHIQIWGEGLSLKIYSLEYRQSK